MARARTYRHDIRCPHCGSNWCKKNGHANGKQTYLCNECFRRFTPDAQRPVFPERLKQEAARMDCEGTGIAAIGRILGVPLGTTCSWLEKSPMGVRGRQGSDRAPPIRSRREHFFGRNVDLRQRPQGSQPEQRLDLDGRGG